MVKINIEKKYLILIGAVFVSLIGINLVVGAWGEDSTHAMWHDDEDIKISSEYSLSDIIGSDGKIHCDNIKGDIGDDTDFCDDEVGGTSSDSSSGATCTKIFDSNDLIGTPESNNYYYTKVDIPGQCYDGGMCRYRAKVWENNILVSDDMTKLFMSLPGGESYWEGAIGPSTNGDSTFSRYDDIEYRYDDYDVILVFDDYVLSAYNYDEKNSNQITTQFANPGTTWRGELWACYLT